MTDTKWRGTLVPPLDLDSVAGRRRAGEPAHRRIARAVRRVFDASAADVQELAQLIATVQQPITTGRRVAVTSVRGGAGKSTVAALLGKVYARRRADRVLAVDADPELGSLSYRLGARGSDPVTVLARRAAQIRSMEELQPLLGAAGNGLWVVPAPEHPGPAAQTVAAARDVCVALSRYFGVTVLDCGHGLTQPTPVLLESHAIVVTAPATIDGVRSTRAALESMFGLDRVVVALTSQNPGSEGVDVRRSVRALGQLGVPVAHIAFDRHLANGGVIDISRLAEPTVVAATRIAALALGQAKPL